MNKFYVIAMATAISAMSFNHAMAQDAVTTETVETATVEMTAENLASTMAMMQPICNLRDTIVLSKDAIAACDGNEKKLPKLTKKGDRFTKGRTGAEFNTLIANLAAFQ